VIVVRITPMEKGEKSSSLGPYPVSMEAVQTAAIIASKTTGRPLQSAPTLVNLSKATSTFGGSSQFGLPLHHKKINPQQMEQPHKLPGARRVSIPSTPTLASYSSQSTPTQETAVTTNFKQKETTDNGKNNIILRSGKWTIEEEIYANILIQLFEEGRVDDFEHSDDSKKIDNSNEQEEHPLKFKITNGMTLRAYLSRKLFCSPMRISKKFAGKGIGKLIYMSQSPGAYQQHWQRLSSSSISNLKHANGTALRSASRCDELNQLKQAESNFLRIAFPNNHPMNVYNKKKISSKYIDMKASFTATASLSKQSAPVPAIAIPLTKSKSADIENKSEASRIGSLSVQPPFTAIKIFAGDSIPALATTRRVLFPCRSPTKNVGNTVNSPLTTFSNQPVQLQHDKSCRIDTSLVKSQHISSIGAQAAATNVQGSLKNLQKYPFPLMAAPKLLSPTQNKIQHKNVVQTSWTAGDLYRVASGASAQLQKLGCDQKRQTVNIQSTSKIETLTEAYFTSVSTTKHSVVTNGTSNNCVTPSIVVQNNPASYVSVPHETVIDLIQEPQIKQFVTKTEDMRIMTIERCNDNDTKSTEAQYKTLKSNSYSTYPSIKLESAAAFDWNQMMESPSKPAIDLPNFLFGFDKVSKHRLYSPSNQSSEKDPAWECAEFSPAYHTSKSFDDFHRYLGKGLSPIVPPQPKFLNLRITNVGPAIPSIEYDKVPVSNLQMRPRNQQNIIPTVMNIDVNNSKASSSTSERSAETVLSEAYAEAIMSSCRQQAPQTQYARGKFDDSGSNQYNIFGEKSVATSSQQSPNNLHTIVPNPDQNQIRKQDSVSDFPLEGMTFEDFETLTSCPDNSTEPCSNLINTCAIVGDQSDGSDDTNSGGGGRSLLDNSDDMQMNESFQGKKRKLRPELMQSRRVRERISFLP